MMEEAMEHLIRLREGLKYCPALRACLEALAMRLTELHQENTGLMLMLKEAEAHADRAENTVALARTALGCPSPIRATLTPKTG